MNITNRKKKREYGEIEKLRHVEIQETKDIFAEYGLDDELQDKVANAIARDKKKWVDFMMRFELGLDKPDKNRAHQSAFIIGISYVAGGFIPLTAYFFTETTKEGLFYSTIITLICLVVFGLIKSKLTGQPLFKGALRVTFVGAVAAAAAFGIATLIA
ncbi:VIT1/CCC1 transporter family protein [Oscillatoria amoena NRMC-F 0135]|nr:VIT1/CCC1 transporter family protein [Oscillatoria amoena NRMC-F 0135]